jgi:hypothetical protein
MKTKSNNDRFQEIRELAIARESHKKTFNSNGTYARLGYNQSVKNYNDLMKDNSLKQLLLKIKK